MRTSDWGSCALCRKMACLRRSHIVPEFMYAPLYHERRMSGFKKGPSGVRPTYLQKGYREHLLCGDCEAHFNDAYERPNVETWRMLVAREGNERISFSFGITAQGTEFVNVRGIDYSSFKLLLLSVLWRAGVAQRPEYAAVKLGPYEETIREMLLQETPGPPLLLPCIMTFLKAPRRLISPPARGKSAGHTTYQFILTNIVLCFFISNHTAGEWMLGVTLNEDGAFQALVTEPEELPVYSKTMEFLRGAKASKARRR